ALSETQARIRLADVAFELEAEVRHRVGVERALRDQNRLYETLVREQSDLGEGVVITEGERIVFANEALGRLYGYSMGELLAMPSYLDLVHPDDRVAVVERLRRRLSGAEPFGAGETRVVRKDGAVIDIEYAAKSVSAAGETVRVIAIVRDVSAKKRTEEQLRRVDELERLQELDRFKTRFLNMAAHEIATPLTPIRLQLHLLRKELPPKRSPALDRSVVILERNVERLGDLLSDLLQAARLQAAKIALERRAVDANRLVVEAVESFVETARARGVHLSTSLAHGLHLDADPARVTQVLFNLVSNALKFTAPGGHVVVETRGDGESVVVAVRDDGEGLTKEQTLRLFQPFSQVHDPAQVTAPGTGLGLYISKGLVELHGGRIWCESDGPGRGTTFAFSLPRVAPAQYVQNTY
ncbi:MAG: PAS domain-containing sensor histidine kinase, partial [Methanobacteriota archaeon]